jgi:hypothetical protein
MDGLSYHFQALFAFHYEMIDIDSCHGFWVKATLVLRVSAQRYSDILELNEK